MAGGGIVAFDEGGDVPGYAEGLYNASQVPSGAIIMGNMYIDPVTGEKRYLPGAEPQRTGYEGMTLGDVPGQIKKAFKNAVDNPSQYITPTERQNIIAEQQNKLTTQNYVPRRSAAQQAEAEAAAAKSDNTSGIGTPPPSTGTPPPPGTGAPTVKPVVPTNPLAGIKALDTKALTAAEAKKQASELSDSAELRKSLEANETFTTKAYDKLLGDYDKKIAAMPEAYKGYEARLQKEEAEAATDKDKALGMAIFQAGLGMMGGTSQYAFENISKGALAGLDNYQSALKDMKKAQRERDKAFADIEAARLAEKRGDLKAHTELQAKGIEALGAAKNRTVDGISKIFQVDTETAKGIFDTKLKEQAQNERTMYTAKVDIAKQGMADAAALQRTNIQANAPTGLERIYKDPALFKKHMEAQTAATGMRGDTAIRETWAKSPYLQAQYPNVDDYVRMMSGTTGSGGEFKVLGSRPAP